MRDRWQQGTISAGGVAIARGHLENRLNHLIDRPGRRRVAQRFAAHLAIEYPAVFTFLLDPTIEATNWRAEQALRPAASSPWRKSVAARAPSSEFKQVFAHNHRTTEVDASRFGPHSLGDLRIVRRYKVRKHQCFDARHLCHASGIFC